MWGLRERRSHGFWLELEVDGGTITEVESSEEETGLGEMLGLFLAALSMPLS